MDRNLEEAVAEALGLHKGVASAHRFPQKSRAAGLVSVKSQPLLAVGTRCAGNLTCPLGRDRQAALSDEQNSFKGDGDSLFTLR